MGRFVRGLTIGLLVFVSLPAWVVVISSFSSAEVLSFPPTGFSLEPYVDLLSDPVVRSALVRSLIVGVEAVVFSVLVGTPAALALFRYRVRLRALFGGYLLLGLATPLVASGVSFLVLFTRMGIIGRLWPIALALSIVFLPILIFSVASALTQMDPSLEEAAATLGAERIQTFLFVTLPSLMPGVVTGAIIIFVLGMTEFLVSLFLTSVQSQTLPIVIFGSLRGPVRPIFAAASGIYVAIALVVVLLITNLGATRDFLYRSD